MDGERLDCRTGWCEAAAEEDGARQPQGWMVRGWVAGQDGVRQLQKKMVRDSCRVDAERLDCRTGWCEGAAEEDSARQLQGWMVRGWIAGQDGVKQLQRKIERDSCRGGW